MAVLTVTGTGFGAYIMAMAALSPCPLLVHHDMGAALVVRLTCLPNQSMIMILSDTDALQQLGGFIDKLYANYKLCNKSLVSVKCLLGLHEVFNRCLHFDKLIVVNDITVY